MKKTVSKKDEVINNLQQNVKTIVKKNKLIQHLQKQYNLAVSDFQKLDDELELNSESEDTISTFQKPTSHDVPLMEQSIHLQYEPFIIFYWLLKYLQEKFVT